jgi:antitoxin HigA-1
MMADFPPAHPGEVLREDFLRPLAMSQYALARALGVPEIRISEIVNGKRAITPDTALRLARYFGTSPEFWLGMQASYDLEVTRERIGAEIDATVRPRAA